MNLPLLIAIDIADIYCQRILDLFVECTIA